MPKTKIREKATSRSRLVPILSTFTYFSSTASENNKQSKPKEHKCLSPSTGAKGKLQFRLWAWVSMSMPCHQKQDLNPDFSKTINVQICSEQHFDTLSYLQKLQKQIKGTSHFIIKNCL